MKLIRDRGLILILIFLGTSCSSQIKLTDYIDTTGPLTMTIITQDKVTGLSTMKHTEILPTSDKFKSFIDWCDNNDKGWRSDFTTFNARVRITQPNFYFHLMTKGVAVEFIDKNGKPRQFSKTTNTDSLYLLTKE